MATRRPKTAAADTADNVIRIDFRGAGDEKPRSSRTRSSGSTGEVVAFPGAEAEPKPTRKRSRAKAANDDTAAADAAKPTADPRKLAAFTELIEQGLVTVTFDPRARGVAVPPQFSERPTLSLNFSHRFNIADFDYDEFGVRATLSFDTGDFRCELPWTSTYLLSSKAASKTYVAINSFPPEAQRMIPQILRQLAPYERMD